MERKTKIQFILGTSLLALFILFTMSLTFVDMQPIGPQGSYVAYAGINNAVHELFGINMMLYNITDWAGVVAIFIALGFAILGLVQWIKRKNILKVDSSILVTLVYFTFLYLVRMYFLNLLLSIAVLF